MQQEPASNSVRMTVDGVARSWWRTPLIMASIWFALSALVPPRRSLAFAALLAATVFVVSTLATYFRRRKAARRRVSSAERGFLAERHARAAPRPRV